MNSNTGENDPRQHLDEERRKLLMVELPKKSPDEMWVLTLEL